MHTWSHDLLELGADVWISAHALTSEGSSDANGMTLVIDTEPAVGLCVKDLFVHVVNASIYHSDVFTLAGFE